MFRSSRLDEADDLSSRAEPRDGRPGTIVDMGRLSLSVRRGWRWIPIAGVLWGALGLLVATQFIKHTFEARTVLIWEPNRSAGPADERQLSTEAETLRLPATILEVRRRLKLTAPAEVVQEQISVAASGGTHLVMVDATAPRATDAVVLADTVVQVFLERQAELVRTRARESLRAMENDLTVVREMRDRARSAYDAFRAEHGILDLEQEMRDTLANRAALGREAQQERAALESLSSQIAALEEQEKRDPQAPVPLGPSTADRLAELQAKLLEARLRYPPGDSRITRIEEHIAMIRNSARESDASRVSPRSRSVSAALASARALHAGAAGRLKSIELELEAVEQRSTRYGSLQGSAQALLDDIQSHVARAHELENQMAQTRQIARTPQVEWRVLTPALEPTSPQRSMRRWVAAGMPLLGMLAALLVLLVHPLLDGRVHTAREAGYWCNAPVLASTAWPHHGPALLAFAEELLEQTALSPGYTLIVGATPREEHNARQLATCLAQLNATQHAQPDRAAQRPTTPRHRPQLPRDLDPPTAHTPARPTTALVVRAQPELGGATFGTADPSNLRRAARTADRVIVLLTSGTVSFAAAAALRTRLGREHGVAVAMLGMTPELLTLPDRIGSLEAFWSSDDG